MDAHSVIMKIATTGSFGLAFILAALIIYIVKPTAGKTLEKTLYLYLFMFLLLSSVLLFMISYVANYAVGVNLKSIIIIVSITHAIGLLIFYYVFIRHVHLLKEPMTIENENENKKEKKAVIVCKKNKKQSREESASVAAFAIVTYSRVLTSLGVIVYMTMGLI